MCLRPPLYPKGAALEENFTAQIPLDPLPNQFFPLCISARTFKIKKNAKAEEDFISKDTQILTAVRVLDLAFLTACSY